MLLAALERHPGSEKRDRGHEAAEDERVGPAVLGSLDEGEDERRQAHGGENAPERVEVVALRVA